MTDIQIGEWIRTDKGDIGRVIKKGYEEDRHSGNIIDKYGLDTGLKTVSYCVINHSKSLLELIKPEDIIIYRIKRTRLFICWNC